MSDLENLERRINDIERRLDDALMNRVVREAAGEPETVRRHHRGSARVLFGVLILLVGLIWLGKNYGLDWLQRVEFWPFAVIACGLFVIFGDRGR